MVVTINTYICNKRPLAIHGIDGSAGKSAVEVATGESGIQVLAKIVPNGTVLPRFNVAAKIVRESANIIMCLGTPELSWARKNVSYGDMVLPDLETLITIEATLPEYPCLIEAAYIYGITLSPADHNMILISKPDRTGGAIPDNKSDACRIGSMIDDVRNTQTDLVPGELLQLAWAVRINNEVLSSLVAGAYFETPAFTGGKIISKQEDDGLYTVQVQGIDVVCLATDWADYQVGDWGYVLKKGDGEATKCNRESEYGSSNIVMPIDQENYRIAPITVNSFGNDGGNFETLDYRMMSDSEFKEFFEISQHIGVVNAVDKANGTVDITINGDDISGSFTNVAVFFHCDGDTTVENGINAFEEGDSVIVLNEGGSCSPRSEDLVVVGFSEDLKHCLNRIKITCNGHVPTKPKKVVFKWEEDEEEKDATVISEEDKPDIIVIPRDLKYPCRLYIENYSGFEDGSGNPIPLFHLWAECEEDDPDARFLYSYVSPAGSTDPFSLYCNNRDDPSHPVSIGASYLCAKQINKFYGTIEEPIGDEEVFDFDNLKILQRVRVQTYIPTDSSVCAGCGFETILHDPDNPADTIVFDAYGSAAFTVKSGNGTITGGCGDGTSASGWYEHKYTGDPIPLESLVLTLVTEDTEGAPAHSSLEFFNKSYNGFMQHTDETGELALCAAEWSDTEFIRWRIESADTPLDRI
jgi:hypothetical protein